MDEVMLADIPDDEEEDYNRPTTLRGTLPEVFEEDALLSHGQATAIYGPLCEGCRLYHRGDCA